MKDGDSCSSRCQIEHELFCGNGRLEDFEACDDGNQNDGDGCSAYCLKTYSYHCDVPGEPCVDDVCGDGRSGRGLCDDGNTDSGDGCSDLCEIELDWTCPLTGACEKSYCGNGSLDQYSEASKSEECDDGNQVSGDGCSAECRLEEGWSCGVYGTACHRPDCGDGYVFGSEEDCDDGNADPGDGCSDTCEIEPDWVCVQLPASDDGAGGATGDQQATLNAPSTCTRSVCGDRIIYRQGGEQCDDGNHRSGDGCSSECKIEGEECDELSSG